MNNFLFILNNDSSYIKILYCILIDFFIYKKYKFLEYLSDCDIINYKYKEEKFEKKHIKNININNIQIFIDFLYHNKIFTRKIKIFTSTKDKLFIAFNELDSVRRIITPQYYIEHNINFIDLYNFFKEELAIEMNEIFIDIMEGIIRFDRKKEFLFIVSKLVLI